MNQVVDRAEPPVGPCKREARVALAFSFLTIDFLQVSQPFGHYWINYNVSRQGSKQKSGPDVLCHGVLNFATFPHPEC
jgi:hypothetical protein